MIVFRLIAFLLIILALMLLGADLVSTLESNGGTVIRSADHLLLIFGTDAKAWAQMRFSPGVANVALVALTWPGWAVLGIPGIVLGLLSVGRRQSYPARPSSTPIRR